jgi:uncharacterized OB-fold protein
LEAGKCERCGKIFFPHRLICDECGNQKMNTIGLSRDGKLVTYTVIHIGPSKFADQAPYAVGIVELKEGVRLLAQLADVDLSKLKVGMPMRVEFRRISEEGDAGILNYGYKCVPN